MAGPSLASVIKAGYKPTSTNGVISFSKAPAPVQPAQMPVQNVGVAQTTTPTPVKATLPQQTTVQPSVSTKINPNKQGTLAYNIWEKNNAAKLAKQKTVAAATPVAGASTTNVLFGKAAESLQATNPSYLTTRNQQIAAELTKSGKTSADVANYLKTQPGFIEADADAQKNTIDSISKLMGGQPAVEGPKAQTPGTYMQDGKEIAILGYSDMDTETKSLIDGMTDAEKKQLDMIYGSDLNAKTEYLRQGKRTQESAKQIRDYTIKIRDLEGNILDIQASQRLRDAGKNVDNIIQNYAYLGQMGAPGVSAQKLTAIRDHIKDAEQKFAEMKVIETKTAEIRQLGLDIDTAQYEKQMADIADDLNMKVGFQIQNAMNDMTAAELAGELDTIDGVTQFKRSLLEKLDSNISGYTEGSMKQMQYITEQYTKIADDAQTRLTEWNTNKNTVNMDMSAAQGYYVDGNGNPLYNANGQTIKIPEKPPLEPQYDEKTGRLVTFSLDENGKIVADVQQVISQTSVQTSGIKAMAKNGYTIEEITKVFPDVDPNIIVEAVLGEKNGPEGITTGGEIDTNAIINACTEIKGSTNLSCGQGVNAYMQAVTGNYGGMGDDLASKYKYIENIGSTTMPKVGGLYAYNSGAKLEDGRDAGHTGIVTKVNADGTFEGLSWNAQAKSGADTTGPATTKTLSPNSSYKFSVTPQGLQEKFGATTKGGFTKEEELAYKKLLTNKVLAMASRLTNDERESMEKGMEEAIKNGDKEQANDLIYSAAMNDKNVNDSLNANMQFKGGLDLLKEALNTYKETGGDTNVFTNIAERTANFMGTTTNKELAKAQNKIGVLVADYIRSISGTAASDVEVARLVKSLPSIKNVEDLNMAIVDSLYELSDRKMKVAVETYLGTYKRYGPQIFPDVYGGQTEQGTTQGTTNKEVSWEDLSF